MAVPRADDEKTESIVVTGARIARRDYNSNSPIVTASSELIGGNDGAPRAARRAAQRGDWNACTVEDPKRSLDGCKNEVDPNGKGEKGRADARIADGLSQAWDGNWMRAIAAFDIAIGIRPKDAFAYLNRGLAHGRLGQTQQAIKDFDLAADYAPYDARIYYHRSVALKVLGQDKRAKADQERAVSLDPLYRDLFDQQD